MNTLTKPVGDELYERLLNGKQKSYVSSATYSDKIESDLEGKDVVIFRHGYGLKEDRKIAFEIVAWFQHEVPFIKKYEDGYTFEVKEGSYEIVLGEQITLPELEEVA